MDCCLRTPLAVADMFGRNLKLSMGCSLWFVSIKDKEMDVRVREACRRR